MTVVAAPPQEEEEGFPMRMVRGMGVPGVDADVPGDVICSEGASPTHLGPHVRSDIHIHVDEGVGWGGG